MMTKCIVCGEKIYRLRKNTNSKLRRSKYAVTCKPKCGRTYRRIAEYVHNRDYKVLRRKFEEKVQLKKGGENERKLKKHL